eukprot:2864782-Pyramimonas_sp.AAC.1
MHPVVTSVGAPCQNGPIKGRNFLDNVLSLGAEARRASILAHERPLEAPSLMTFDYAQAFPSASQSRLFCCLERSVIPCPFLLAPRGLHHNMVCYYGGGEQLYMFSMRSGVLQGCPLSGTLYVNPFLFDLERSLSTPSPLLGIPRA